MDSVTAYEEHMYFEIRYLRSLRPEFGNSDMISCHQVSAFIQVTEKDLHTTVMVRGCMRGSNLGLMQK